MSAGGHQLGTVVTVGGALLLLWAGAPRLVATPAATADHRRRLTGLTEVLLGVGVLTAPGRLANAGLAGCFCLFTVVHLRALAINDEECDCFGESERVAPGRAALLTGALALLAAGAAAVGAPSLRQLAVSDPTTLAWVPSAALILMLAWRVAFSGAGSLAKLTDVTGDLIERRGAGARADARTLALPGVQRRSFLLRVAVFGSALAAAPLRYVLYPGTALAAVVGPGDCASGICLDGYTAFCCEIQPGGANTCPTGTFPGGWWMCTDYSGRRLCAEQGVRYYVDCNALPGHPFPGGCRCANDNCNERRIACNVFRYGQCNTQIEGTTAVVCRMVTCENPATISELHCSSALAVDDSVCGHEAPCLEPKALELAGAGGV